MNGTMSTSTVKEISDARSVKILTDREAGKLREEVKGIMWGYYSMNKFSFHESIRDYREDIIIELMKGGNVREVFELFGETPVLSAQVLAVESSGTPAWRLG